MAPTVGILGDRVGGQAEVHRERHQVLLGAVVEVALDPPPLGVGGGHEPDARGAQLVVAVAEVLERGLQRGVELAVVQASRPGGGRARPATASSASLKRSRAGSRGRRASGRAAAGVVAGATRTRGRAGARRGRREPELQPSQADHAAAGEDARADCAARAPGGCGPRPGIDTAVAGQVALVDSPHLGGLGAEGRAQVLGQLDRAGRGGGGPASARPPNVRTTSSGERRRPCTIRWARRIGPPVGTGPQPTRADDGSGHDGRDRPASPGTLGQPATRAAATTAAATSRPATTRAHAGATRRSAGADPVTDAPVLGRRPLLARRRRRACRSIRAAAAAATSRSWVTIEDRLAVGVEPAEQLEDLGAAVGVEGTGGLVGQEERRLVDERAGDGQALALTAGERRRGWRRPCRAGRAGRAGRARAARRSRRAGAGRPARRGRRCRGRVIPSMRLKNWNTMPTWRRRIRARASSDASARSRPTTRTLPASGRSSPARTLRNVDLPQPDGPVRATNSPHRTTRSAPRRARTGAASRRRSCAGRRRRGGPRRPPLRGFPRLPRRQRRASPRGRGFSGRRTSASCRRCGGAHLPHPRRSGCCTGRSTCPARAPSRCSWSRRGLPR